MDDFCYRFLNCSESGRDNILGCGYMDKKIGIGDFATELNYFSAVWLLDGEGVYIGGDGKTTRLKKGSVFYRLPYSYHRTFATNNSWKEFFLCFGYSVANCLMDMNLIKAVGIRGFREVTPEMKAVFDRLLCDMRQALDSMLPGMLLSCINAVYRFAESKPPAEKSEDKMDTAREMLGSDLKSERGIKDIAEKLGMCYSSFRKEFYDANHISPQGYRMLCRINMAKRLLAENRRSVSEIADTLGFCDEFAFMKQFKKVTGMTTRGFREELMPGDCGKVKNRAECERPKSLG